MGEISSAEDFVRRKYITLLSTYTKRNVIVYYSGWLQKQPANQVEAYDLMVNDNDINGFMTTVNKLDRTKGLDLILHTPGGEMAATQTIVEYLNQMFGNDIRAIIPQLAMSAGTVIACGCKKIMMGKQSSLGPMDPQYRGNPAHAVVEEFETAIAECKADPGKIPLWQPIIAKYNPTMIGECKKVIALTTELVTEWLKRNMFCDDPKKEEKIKSVIKGMVDHEISKIHDRHFNIKNCEDMGLVIEKMEDDQPLQDLILSVHHSCVLTLSRTSACKIFENQMMSSYILKREHKDPKPFIIPLQGGMNIEPQRVVHVPKPSKPQAKP